MATACATPHSSGTARNAPEMSCGRKATDAAASPLSLKYRPSSRELRTTHRGPTSFHETRSSLRDGLLTAELPLRGSAAFPPHHRPPHGPARRHKPAAYSLLLAVPAASKTVGDFLPLAGPLSFRPGCPFPTQKETSKNGSSCPNRARGSKGENFTPSRC